MASNLVKLMNNLKSNRSFQVDNQPCHLVNGRNMILGDNNEKQKHVKNWKYTWSMNITGPVWHRLFVLFW